MNEKWYWIRIGTDWSPAVKDKTAVGEWTNLDTWEDFNHEVEEFIEIPSPKEIKDRMNI